MASTEIQAVLNFNQLKEMISMEEVTFMKEENGIRVTADIEGLKPGKHGFHIHEIKTAVRPTGSPGAFNPAHKIMERRIQSDIRDLET
jgi:Cu/Zn superoxide dismutase